MSDHAATLIATNTFLKVPASEQVCGNMMLIETLWQVASTEDVGCIIKEHSHLQDSVCKRSHWLCVRRPQGFDQTSRTPRVCRQLNMPWQLDGPAKQTAGVTRAALRAWPLHSGGSHMCVDTDLLGSSSPL
jgi:hypothetical protein